MRRGTDIPACRWLLAVVSICPSYTAALPLSPAAIEPDGDWLAASVVVEDAEHQYTFREFGILAALSDDWRMGLRIPLHSGVRTTRWSTARSQGELAALRRFPIAPRLNGTAAVGASFDSGDESRHAHLFTGSVLGLGVRRALTPWSQSLGVALQQFEPHRDGSRPGDIWSLRLATRRALPGSAGSWFARSGSKRSSTFRPHSSERTSSRRPAKRTVPSRRTSR